ncbi:hypothetical protein MHYP_G00315340 [Metynnis hypsauchen]
MRGAERALYLLKSMSVCFAAFILLDMSSLFDCGPSELLLIFRINPTSWPGKGVSGLLTASLLEFPKGQL